MPTVKFFNTATASTATSITIQLAVVPPTVGDLVLVFLLTDNEIITHQPGYASEFTTTPNPWFKLDGIRSPNTGTLTGWYHTWNASDTGNTATFSFVAAPTLGIGDKDVSSTNAVAISMVLDGSLKTALLEHNVYGSAQDFVNTIMASPLKLFGGLTFHAVGVSGSTASLTDSDSLASLVTSVTLASPTGLSLAVFERVNSPALYQPSFTLSSGSNQSLMVAAVSVSDNQPQIYNAPFIEEGPVAENPLMWRYRLARYFTVLNNSGTFVAKRYLSTDDIAAATQVFTNNQPILSTDRTNILTAGVGGDFKAVS